MTRSIRHIIGGTVALALAACADARPAFALLLTCAARGLFALRLAIASLLLRLGVVFRLSGFVKRDGDRLLAALHFAASAAASSLELAVLVFVHDAPCRLSLSW